MTLKVALQKREQMLRDGFWVINNILTDEFLKELRDESERLLANYVQPDHTRYTDTCFQLHLTSFQNYAPLFP